MEVKDLIESLVGLSPALTTNPYQGVLHNVKKAAATH